jgi:hypothetical protein
MSRHSRRGRHAHSHAPGRPPHHGQPTPERPAAPPDPAPKRPDPGVAAAITARAVAAPAPPATEPPAAVAPPVLTPVAEVVPPAPPVAAAHPEPHAAAPVVEVERPPAADRPLGIDMDQQARTTCTTAQLRRFIKSRPWVPLHELRRRFGISGDDDDVSPIRVGDQRLFVGLPPAEARMVGELLSGGDVGYELSLDPTAPIVVGVYPMRPVPRG